MAEEIKIGRPIAAEGGAFTQEELDARWVTAHMGGLRPARNCPVTRELYLVGGTAAVERACGGQLTGLDLVALRELVYATPAQLPLRRPVKGECDNEQLQCCMRIHDALAHAAAGTLPPTRVDLIRAVHTIRALLSSFPSTANLLRHVPPKV